MGAVGVDQVACALATALPTIAPSADDARLQRAVSRLERLHPGFSARSGLWPRQSVLLCALLLLALSAFVLAPALVMLAMNILLALAFALLLAPRVLAIGYLLTRSTAETEPVSSDDASLPVYTILVALHDEAAVVPELVRALSALDYPAAKLDVIFALESHDRVTRGALEVLGLPAHMRLAIVPVGEPRTKPRALCYAMTLARGDFVVVYDAEDEPAPDQLRLALAAFDAGGGGIGCVQARLAIHNGMEGWFPAQFAIEYAVLFGAVLPALAARGLPVPLGGTSNHFPRHVLESVGGWDPFNVTEDADLGLRLARLGWRVAVIASATLEEAPPNWRVWFAQRVRWQKGWLQTYFVHMREPVRAWRELGPASWIGFQIVLFGGLLSAFAHPWFYLWLIWNLAPGASIPLAGWSIATWLWWIALANLAAAYLATIVLALMTLATGDRRHFLVPLLLAPLYWVPVSIAAYWAVGQLIRRPTYWAKTPHRPRSPPVQP